MRNWNNIHLPSFFLYTACSYFTYEELKQEGEIRIINEVAPLIFYLWGIETEAEKRSQTSAGSVNILPMRNWNAHALVQRLIDDALIFYLWGIETRFHA